MDTRIKKAFLRHVEIFKNNHRRLGVFRMIQMGCFVSFLCGTTLTGWATSSPVPMLENSAQQIIKTLETNKVAIKSNHQIISSAIERHLLPHVDVTGMSRSVLGREAWMKATAAEKKEFTHAFTQLVVRTYSNPLADYSGETVKFYPLRAPAEGRFARVNSVIVRPNGQSIPLSYSVVSKDGQWKIYDLSVEGVSLLQSFRQQFSQVLQSSSMQTLLAEMHQKQKGDHS